MSRLLAPAEAPTSSDARSRSVPSAPSVRPPAPVQQEVEDLRREVASLRLQHRRDLATARGLGEALQTLRRGAMALRAENEELRRQATGRAPKRR